ncbi:MAG: MmcQ/YjbR family DNA-binding protein [Acidimicrobiales bacterium]|nr:MmcQ/YjbR family DNA-binding protein [Acidimicrobiales bacterium]
MEYPEVPTRVIGKLRKICAGLPETHEEAAWTGKRWMVRKRTFAHVLAVEGNSSPAFVRASGRPDDVVVMTFRSMGPELVALRNAGHPFFAPGWGHNVVGIVLDDNTDWGEVAELLADSYCVLAPKKLAALINPSP